MSDNTLPVLGFVGTGTINSALVKGFCRFAAPAYPIVVSPQYEKNAKELKELFPDRVTVAQSIQEVVDKADWVIVAVLPGAAEEVYSGTKFRPEQKVINLIPTASFEQIREWIGETAVLAHIIPLVFVADVRGPIVLCPDHAEVRALLEPIGDVVAVNTRQEAALLQDVTGLEAPFFTLESEILKWCTGRGLDERTALLYMSSFFKAMAAQSQIVTPARVHALADEFTPGGLNWLGKVHLTEETDSIAQWITALDRIADKNS
ncbi:MAG: NAD(P)-binding domain-containing protein [Lachnospiraceae bacterium]|nr:NAD(P)-binding domain-containing protein [Lachnospiraceae bacterium]